MQVGDLVEGFATHVLGLKGFLTNIEYHGATRLYYILWSDGTHWKHLRHHFTAELS